MPILPSLTACAVVLILISVVGVFGSWKHDQVYLFFYLIILFCLFVVQFAISFSCLAVKQSQSDSFAEDDWNKISDDLKQEFEKNYNCNTFQCNSTMTSEKTSCTPCFPKLKDIIDSDFKISGAIGVVFSFTEVI